MDIYNYDRVTGEFINTEAARKRPLEEDVFAIPAYAAVDAPPEPFAGKSACYLTATGVSPEDYRDGAWLLVEDRRGQYYRAADGAPVYLDRLGVQPESEGLTALVPAENTLWDGAQWAPDTAKLKALANADIQRQIQVIELTEQPAAQRLFAIKGDNSAMIEIQARIDALEAQLQA